MPQTETVERRSRRDGGVFETRSAEQGVALGIVAAALVAATVAWVGALVVLVWWLIRAIL
jgi:cell division septal protein FtsQ